MDVDGFLLSRRRFLAASGASVLGASAVLLSACGDDTKSGPAGPDESDAADVEILNSVRDLELMAVAAYKEAAALLKGDALQVGKLLLEQEQAHADGLAAAIKDAGGTPNRARSAYDFPRLRSQDDALRYGVDLEGAAIAAYIDALPKLGKGDLRATAASIAANDAEHMSILLGALGEQQVPDAFVYGRAP